MVVTWECSVKGTNATLKEKKTQTAGHFLKMLCKCFVWYWKGIHGCLLDH